MRLRARYGALDVMILAEFVYVGMWHSEFVEARAGGVLWWAGAGVGVGGLTWGWGRGWDRSTYILELPVGVVFNDVVLA